MITSDTFSKLKIESSPPKSRGEWFLIQWSPDAASSERLNIGICYDESSGERYIRTLNSYKRLSCIYGNEIESVIDFQIKLLQDVLKNSITTPPSSNITYCPPREIKGESPQLILDELFEAFIPLAITEKDKPGKKFVSEDTLAVRKKVYDFMRIRDSYRSNIVIPISSQYPMTDEVAGHAHFLDLPLRSNNDSHVGTIISARYKKKDTIEKHISRAFRDIYKAGTIRQGAKLGLYVVSADTSFGLTPDEVSNHNDLIQEIFWTINSSRIDLHHNSSTEVIAEHILKWAPEPINQKTQLHINLHNQ